MESQDTLSQRYGVPADSRRPTLIVVALVLTVVFGGWLTWVIIDVTQAPVTSKLETFSILDDSTVTATLVVILADRDVEATCRLRALAEDHSTVGELAFTPDPDAGSRQVVEIRTERRASAVQSLGCTAPGQPRPR
ncbi:DUF4307 domain-containing protein [Nocardioides sp.]|uniref:DUF4307 domain-containing protein n=1 Tax=Nocardioides sp. TaxID=35761 RepID=UPI003564ADC9